MLPEEFISKHSLRLSEAEAVLCGKALDELDEFSPQRIAILQRKYLLDRPIRPYYPPLAKLALKIFLEPDAKGIHYLPWVQQKIMSRKKQLIEDLREGIREYEVLLNLKQKALVTEYEKQLDFMKQKYLK